MAVSGVKAFSVYGEVDVRGTENAQRKLSALDKHVERSGSNMGRHFATIAKVAAVAFASVLAGIAIVGAKAIQLGAEFEQTRIGMTTLLGSAQKAYKMLDQLSRFAARTPFELSQVEKSAKLLLGLGFSAESIIPTLTAVGDAVSAVGGGAETLDRVIIALGQMKAKGVVSAEEMMQITEHGIPAWKMLAKILNTDVQSAMKLVEKRMVDSNVVVPKLIAAMEAQYRGMMKNQMTTLAGMWSNFKDNLTRIGRIIGKVLIDAFQLKPKMAALTAFLGDLEQMLSRVAQAGWAKAIGEQLNKWGVPQSFQDSLWGIVSAFKRIGDGISSAKTQLKLMWDWWAAQERAARGGGLKWSVPWGQEGDRGGKAYGGLDYGGGKKYGGLDYGLRTQTEASKPYGGLDYGLGVGKKGGGAAPLDQNHPIIRFFKLLGDALLHLFAAAKNTMSFLGFIIDPNTSDGLVTFGNAVHTVAAALERLTAALRGLAGLTKALGGLPNLLTTLVPMLQGPQGGMRVKPFFDQLAGGADFWMKLGLGQGGVGLGGGVDLSKMFNFTTIRARFAQLGPQLAPFLNGIRVRVIDAFRNAFVGAIGWLGRLPAQAGGWFSRTAATIGSWMRNIGATIVNGFRNAFPGVYSWLTRMWSTVSRIFWQMVSGVGSIWGRVVAAVTTPVNRVIDVINGLIDRLNSIITKFPGIKAVPKLGHVGGTGMSLAQRQAQNRGLRYAKGGAVTGGKKGTDSVAAWLMPGEHVWTADEVKRAGGHGAMYALRKKYGGAGKQAPGMFFAVGGGIDPARMKAMKDTAWKMVGRPYVWGGASMSGADCSGLVTVILKAGGWRIPGGRLTTATIPGWAHRGTGPVTIGLKPGKHTGISLDGSWFEAPHRGALIRGPGAAKSRWPTYWVPPGAPTGPMGVGGGGGLLAGAVNALLTPAMAAITKIGGKTTVGQIVGGLANKALKSVNDWAAAHDVGGAGGSGGEGGIGPVPPGAKWRKVGASTYGGHPNDWGHVAKPGAPTARYMNTHGPLYFARRDHIWDSADFGYGGRTATAAHMDWGPNARFGASRYVDLGWNLAKTLGFSGVGKVWYRGLKRGGIVRRPTFAMLGEGKDMGGAPREEAVVPLEGKHAGVIFIAADRFTDARRVADEVRKVTGGDVRRGVYRARMGME